jgi:hypothetical protein
MPAGQHADRHARREQAALTHSAQSAASGVAVTGASSDEHPSRHSAPLWNAYCIGEFPVGAHFRKQLPVTACFESCLSLAKSRVNSVVQGWISSRFWNSRFKRAAFNQGDELS